MQVEYSYLIFIPCLYILHASEGKIRESKGTEFDKNETVWLNVIIKYQFLYNNTKILFITKILGIQIDKSYIFKSYQIYCITKLTKPFSVCVWKKQ